MYSTIPKLPFVDSENATPMELIVVMTAPAGIVAMAPLTMTARPVEANVLPVVPSAMGTAHVHYVATTPFGRMEIPTNVDAWKMVPNVSPVRLATSVVMERMMTTDTPVEGHAPTMVKSARTGKTVTYAVRGTATGSRLVNTPVVPNHVTKMENRASPIKTATTAAVEAHTMMMVLPVVVRVWNLERNAVSFLPVANAATAVPSGTPVQNQ
jgi:hypothetical protein